MEETAPRKPKQLHRQEQSPNTEFLNNYDLFQNEETSSFLSASFCEKPTKTKWKQNQSSNNSSLDISLDDIESEGNHSSIKYLPLFYFLASAVTFFGGLFSAFQKQRNPLESPIPHFLELPFKKQHPFLIGVGIVCLIGILNNVVAYKMWKQSKESFRKTQLLNCFIGMSAQLSLLAFACLPAVVPKNHSLKSEDCILLNLYFALSFIYQGIYVFCLTRSVPNLVKITYSYQIRIAFFMLSLLVFAFYITSSLISHFGFHTSATDQISENTHSICAFLLFSLNTVFISLLYFDLKTVNLVMKFADIEHVKSIRKFNQNIL